jgi:hypothetical protein
MTRYLIPMMIFHAASAWGQEVSHFRYAEIPKNESRLSELARVREFRCDYELTGSTPYTKLIVEVFKDGKSVDRYLLSTAVYSQTTKNAKGIISIGWNRDTHNLVSVQENGERYSPWTGCAHISDFSPMDAYYFSDSLPETRKAEGDGYDFQLYPVIGLCGERNSQIDYPKNGKSQSFLKACTDAGAKDAVIVYLYYSDGGQPNMKFTKSNHEQKAEATRAAPDKGIFEMIPAHTAREALKSIGIDREPLSARLIIMGINRLEVTVLSLNPEIENLTITFWQKDATTWTLEGPPKEEIDKWLEKSK